MNRLRKAKSLYKTVLLGTVHLLFCLGYVLPVCAQSPSSPQEATPPEAVVQLGDIVIFQLKHAPSGMSIQQRAQLINARLQRLVNDPKALPEDFEVGVDSVTGLPFIRHKRYQGVLFTINASDAGERSPIAVATDYLEKLQEALRQIRLQQQQAERMQQLRALRREYIRGAFWALIYTLLLPLLWRALSTVMRFVDTRLQSVRYYHQGVHWRGVHLLSVERVKFLVQRWIALEHFIVYTALLLVYLQLMLHAFPATRPHSNWLWHNLLTALTQIGSAVVSSLPGLFNILLIAVIARLVLRGFEALMSHAEAGTISLEPYVPQEFVKPTRSLGKFVIVLVALFFIAPNIPGAGTDFAKVITVFIGVIVSFSSTTTVGNFLAGVVLAYMRPFRRGDRVKIGEVMGDVVDSNFLHTRLRTPKNEEVLIPSMQILSGTVVNYSSAPEGVILYTTVSIGYDVPRKQVEQLLLEAACRTQGCEQQPPPFVLVRSLDDSYVTYELNVYTRNPNQMQAIYSRLHQNIKDVFDAAGVEIMSPHYLAIRDGNRVTIPEAEP
ncbi:MAG: mechanosensitive ion channel protein [Armatimonadota bacterium]|nr:MAG: mechanosensitive ion channel protein [Armatimonadota bacterium]